MTDNDGIPADQMLATRTQAVASVSCSFRCEKPALVRVSCMEVHLYGIAREAVLNAIRRGRARQIAISPNAGDGRITFPIVHDPQTTGREKRHGIAGHGLPC